MSDKLPRVTGEELVRALKRAGFVERGQRSSHLHLFREADRRRLVVPVHKGQGLPIGTLHAILRDAGIDTDEFRHLLNG